MNTALSLYYALGGKAQMAVLWGSKRDKFTHCTKRGPGRISARPHLAKLVAKLQAAVPERGFRTVPGIPGGLWAGDKISMRAGRISLRSASGTLIARTKG